MNIETEVLEEEINNTAVEEPPVEIQEPTNSGDVTHEQIAETNRIIKDVQEKLSKTPGQQTPDQNQVREMIKQKTGLSNEGIEWVMNLNREVVSSAVAPLQEKLAWSDLKSSKASTHFPINAEIEKEMKEELKAYPVDKRGDPVLLDKVYLLAIGKIHTSRKPDQTQENPVIGRRIVTNNPNPAGSNSGGSNKSNNSSVSKLSDQEKTIARKMGVSEADYAKYKQSPIIQGR